MSGDFHKIEITRYSDIGFFARKYNTKENFSPLHCHDFLQINYISEGECIHFLDNKNYDVKKGDIFVIPPDIPHCIKKKENCSATIYEIELTPNFINNSVNTGNKPLSSSDSIFWDFTYLSPFMVDLPHVHPGFSLPENIMHKTESLFADMLCEYTQRDEGFEYVISGYLLSLLTLIGREYKKAINSNEDSKLYITRKQNIIDAIEYINNHYGENITVSDIAKRSYLSPSYFKSLFKYFTSKTFVEYLTDVRISHAAILLRQTDMKVIDIAYETGFNYVNHFNRVFKQIMNVTPLQYRKNYLKKKQ